MYPLLLFLMSPAFICPFTPHPCILDAQKHNDKTLHKRNLTVIMCMLTSRLLFADFSRIAKPKGGEQAICGLLCNNHSNQMDLWSVEHSLYSADPSSDYGTHIIFKVSQAIGKRALVIKSQKSNLTPLL